MPDSSPDRPTGLTVPPLLASAAAVAWRLIVVAAAAAGLGWLLSRVMLLVIPFATALLVSSLLEPLVGLLRRRGVGRAASTWITMVLLLLVIGFGGWFVANRVAAQVPVLAEQFQGVASDVEKFLADSPLHLDVQGLRDLQKALMDWVNGHRAALVHGVASTTLTVIEVLTGAVLMLFTTFFLLYDGGHLWRWVVGLFRARNQKRVDEAGRHAWTTLTGWVRGTTLIAVFHATVIGTTLFLIGAPLVAALAVLVFFGSFIPLVGAVVAGATAVLVVLFAKGLTSALILSVVLFAENQAEAHLLQPFVVGHYVQLHPLAIALVLTAGGLLGGIVGAIIAVPLVASARHAWHALFPRTVP